MWQNGDPVSFTKWSTDTSMQPTVHFFVRGHTKGTKDIPYCKYNSTKELWLVANTNTRTNSNHRPKPYVQGEFKCVAMTLRNLADPQWILVNCSDSLSNVVYCMIEKNKRCSKEIDCEQKHFAAKNNNVCKKNRTLLMNLCYHFTWTNLSATLKSKVHHIFPKRELQILFDAISDSFPPIFSVNISHFVKFNKCSKTYSSEQKVIETEYFSALLISVHKLKPAKKKNNIFNCAGKSYIAMLYVCDGKQDCPSRAYDEEGCVCNKTKAYSGKCKYVVGQSSMRSCSAFFVTTSQKECELYSGDERLNHNAKMLVKSGVDISTEQMSLRNTMVNSAKEGNSDAKRLSESCERKGQLTCLFGHLKCYNISQICVYKLNTSGHIKPCASGDHIHNCTAFACNGMFKCPGYYCVPWSYVCDSKWDCPTGFEETTRSCHKHHACLHLFKCRNSRCVHLGNVCDGQRDCPFGDDEFYCSLQILMCPSDCECLLFTLRCYNTTFSPENNMPFHIVWIHVASFTSTLSSLVFKDAVVLAMTKTGLTNLCELIFQMKNLIKLDASFNSVTTVQPGCFQLTLQLRFAVLACNQILLLKSETFLPLSNLQILNLTGNQITLLQNFLFSNNSKLKTLSLNNNSIAKVEKGLFKGTHLFFLQTDNFALCCILPSGGKCTMELPWYLSCSKLLPNLGIQITFYSVSFIMVIFNFFSTILQKISFLLKLEKTGAYGATIASINIGDIFCAVPLFVLWAADLYFKAPFILNEIEWRSGGLCYLSFGITLWFALLSPILLSFLSLSRLMVVMHPMDTNFKQTKYVLKFLAIIFIFCAILACTLTILTWVLLSLIPFILCSPFVDPMDSSVVISVLTWVVVIFQVGAAIFIIVVYMILVRSLKISQKAIQQAASKKQSNVALIVQVIIVTSSNILCWVPSGVIFLTSLFLEEYPVTMVIWITIAVAPSNSVVNPVVFGVTSLRKILKKQTV